MQTFFYSWLTVQVKTWFLISLSFFFLLSAIRTHFFYSFLLFSNLIKFFLPCSSTIFNTFFISSWNTFLPSLHVRSTLFSYRYIYNSFTFFSFSFSFSAVEVGGHFPLTYTRTASTFVQTTDLYIRIDWKPNPACLPGILSEIQQPLLPLDICAHTSGSRADADCLGCC